MSSLFGCDTCRSLNFQRGALRGFLVAAYPSQPATRPTEMRSVFALFISIFLLLAYSVAKIEDFTETCVQEARPQPYQVKCDRFGDCCKRICSATAYNMKCSYSYSLDGGNYSEKLCHCLGPIVAQSANAVSPQSVPDFDQPPPIQSGTDWDLYDNGVPDLIPNATQPACAVLSTKLDLQGPRTWITRTEMKEWSNPWKELRFVLVKVKSRCSFMHCEKPNFAGKCSLRISPELIGETAGMKIRSYQCMCG